MIDYALIPPRIMAGLRRYVDDHLQPGHFLCMVLQNDLFGAVGRADDEAQAALPSIVGWIYNEAPSECWGDQRAVAAWLAARQDDQSQQRADHQWPHPSENDDGDAS